MVKLFICEKDEYDFKCKFYDSCNHEIIRQDSKAVGECVESKRIVFSGPLNGLFVLNENSEKFYFKYDNTQVDFFRDSIESIESWLFYNEIKVNITQFITNIQYSKQN